MSQPRKRKSGKCVTPGCGGKPIARGLCQACFASAKRLVRDRITDWPELEFKELCDPVSAGESRGKCGLFLKAFANALRTK